MPIFIALIAALGGVTLWRRKRLGADAKSIGATARDTVHGLRTGRAALIGELGERAYARSTGDDDPDNEDEISRIVGELVQIDAASKADPAPSVEAFSANGAEGLTGADATA